ncbi:hypothetical protein HDF14_004072 [Edaphobacter lichenicola]|uniref:Uncharacterized protein n=1 Tax=Tunturiibacter gelidiferens TaxID=3069689 RepID=A0A9X0QHB0_9BACT|nr:hypothetical protein [Edaphobacter lichenicola]
MSEHATGKRVEKRASTNDVTPPDPIYYPTGQQSTANSAPQRQRNRQP